MRLSSDDLQSMPNRERAALVNSLSGFKSANLIGTADQDGHCNLAIMSSVVHLGSHPPLLALVVRPGGEERHTLHNLLRSGHYSINHVACDMVEAAHQTAARYDRGTSEFEATGLTPAWWDDFSAPLVAEAPIMPVFHTSVRLLVKPWVTRYPTTGLREWFLKDVIIKPH